MPKKPYEEMTGVVDVDELASMIASRETLRALYGEMQTAAHATSNPLFEVYLERIALAGARLNGHIQSWYERHSLEYGEYEPEDAPGDES